jgi:arylsulfatase A-like enzyme
MIRFSLQLGFTILGVIVSICPLFGQSGNSQKPNIIVFMVDDMGWQDTSVPFYKEVTPFNKRYRTPNMERLAQRGVKFTNAYAASVCTPTRVSLLTGMSTARHKVTNWTQIVRNVNADSPDTTFAPVDWNINGFSPVPNVPKTVHATPLPELLRNAGYYTIHAGKAHWGAMGTPGANPTNLGFMVNIAGHAAGHPQSYLGTENYGNRIGKFTYHAVPGLEEYYGSETFLSDALTKDALKALEQPVKEKRPFFLHMSHYAIHVPLQADRRYFDNYLRAGLDSTEAKYASLIEGMDTSLGDLMDYLDKNHLTRNTVIIFMSDNGGLSLAPPRSGKPHTQNLPLKAGKGSLHEGGIREPMLVSWPGVVKPSSVCDQYLIIEDFFPTILEMAKVKLPKTIQEIDGVSFMRYLKDPSQKDNQRSIIWHYPNKWGGTGPGINHSSAIRKGDWKLIYSMKDGKLSLFNLTEDIGEEKDLSTSNPEMTKKLADELTARLKALDAQMPRFLKGNEQAKWPNELR